MVFFAGSNAVNLVFNLQLDMMLWFLGRPDLNQNLTMDVHLGFVHLSLSKLTAYIAQYGLQTTEFWLSTGFETTGNISKQPEVSANKVFLVIAWSGSCFLLHVLHQVCRFLSSCVPLHLGPSPNCPSSNSAAQEGKSPHENRQGQIPPGCSWLHTKIFHSLESCSHSKPVQMWGWKPQSGHANHGLEKASSF